MEAEEDGLLEAAIVESLEDVLQRADLLQQHLVELPGSQRLVRPGDLGSPERLRAFAMGATIEPQWVAGVGSSDSTVPTEGVPDDRSILFQEGMHEDDFCGPGLSSSVRSGTGAADFRRLLQDKPSSQLGKRASGTHADDDRRAEKRLALLTSRAEAATARANAACDALERLVERTCGEQSIGASFGRVGHGSMHGSSGSTRGVERPLAWIEECEARLLAWVEERHEQNAASELRALQLDAQLRGERDDMWAVHTREHGRAERAEGRCRQLVRALRTSQRAAVDEIECAADRADSPLVGSHVLRQGATSLSARSRSERWENGCEAAAQLAKAQMRDGAFRKQALANQLTLPCMPAVVAARPHR